MTPRLAVAIGAVAACACGKPGPPVSHREFAGTLTVDGAPAELVRCRPGHDVHVYVEVDTARGVLRFGSGALAWNGTPLACQKLDRSWGGGIRNDGAAYFRGTLAFRCGALAGDLNLDCGRITPEEAAELAHNRSGAAAPATPRPGGQAGGESIGDRPARCADRKKTPDSPGIFPFSPDCAIPPGNQEPVTVASSNAGNRAGLIVPSSRSKMRW